MRHRVGFWLREFNFIKLAQKRWLNDRIIYDTKMAMSLPAPNTMYELAARREALGMNFVDLALRSGVSEPTVKRIFGGRIGEASFSNIIALMSALQLSMELTGPSATEACRAQAREKAKQVARLVQGTSALENQAVDAVQYKRLVERTRRYLLAGSRRKLWSA